MADSSVPITAGAGTNIDTRTESVNGDHRQVVVIGDPVTGGNVQGVSATGGAYVRGVFGTTTTLNVTTSSSTTGTLDYDDFNVVSIQINGTHAGINLTFEVSSDGTNWIPIVAARTDITGSAVNGVTGVITSNAAWGWELSLGAYRYFRCRSTAYTSGTGVVQVGGQWGSYEVTPTATLGTGANVIGALTANQSVNVAQINAVTPLMGNGVTGTGSQRVTIASDNTAFSVNTTPVTPTTSAVNSAATTNATAVKGSAGTVYAVTASNAGAAAAFVKLYNKATAPTVGTDVPWITLQIPAGSTVSIPFGTQGVRFTTGIGLAITNLVADSDTTAVVASQVKVLTTFI